MVNHSLLNSEKINVKVLYGIGLCLHPTISRHILFHYTNTFFMRKAIISCIFLALTTLTTWSQTAAIDKNKVLDYFQNQQFEEAINYVQPALGADSSNMQALGFAGYAWYMSERIPQAELCYLKMVAIDSTNITANHYLAGIYNNREIDLSMFYIARLIRLQPAKSAYYRTMGELLSRKNEKDTALLYLNQAYALAPNDLKNISALADVWLDKKEYKKADSILQVGLAKDSIYLPYLKLCIRSGYETKNYVSIIMPGEKLMRQSEISSNYLSKLIIAYYNLNQYEDCIRVCEYLFDNRVELEGIYYYEAKAYAKLKNFDKSNELLQICLHKAISENAETYYFSLGENYEATTSWKKAIAAYDTAFYLFKKPLALYSIGRIYEVEWKNEELARKYYLKYLAAAKPEAADERKAYRYVKERYGKKNMVQKKLTPSLHDTTRYLPRR